MKQWVKWAIGLTCVLCVGMCATGCGKNKQTQKAGQEKKAEQKEQKEPKEELLTLTVSADGGWEKEPLTVIREQGYDKEEGFLLSFSEDNNLEEGSWGVQLVMGEYADVFRLHKKGIDARIIGNSSNDLVLLAAKDSELRSLTDCKDETVWHKKNMDDYALDYLLAQENYRSDFVKREEMDSYEKLSEGLKKKEISMAILPEPFATSLMNEGCVCLARGSASRFCDRCLIASHEEMQKNKELYQAFYRAYEKAIAYLILHPVEEKGADYVPEFTLLEQPEDEMLYDVYVWAKENLDYTDEYQRNQLVETIGAGDSHE